MALRLEGTPPDASRGQGRRVRGTRGAPCPDSSGEAGRSGPKHSGDSALRARSQRAPVGGDPEGPRDPSRKDGGRGPRAGRRQGADDPVCGADRSVTRGGGGGRAPAGEGPARARRGRGSRGAPGPPGGAGMAGLREASLRLQVDAVSSPTFGTRGVKSPEGTKRKRSAGRGRGA